MGQYLDHSKSKNTGEGENKMGGGHWDSKLYATSAKVRAVSGVKDFAHSGDVMSRAKHDRKAHADLEPLAIKDTANHIRESRDSDEHPESRAIAVIFDVTGSMGTVPQIFQKNLNKLMSLLVLEGKIEHPQILIGAVGDATCDAIPLQISQFESNNLIDEHIRKVVLEGGGGGQFMESYELALYAMARLTEMDCLDKRGQKGYLFLSGDEMPYPVVKKDEVNRVFGVGEEADVLIEDIIKEVKEKWEVYFIIPEHTYHARDPKLQARWNELLGQNVLRLDDESAICELVASTVSAEEGIELNEILENLKKSGINDKVRNSVEKTLTAVR